MNNFKDFNIEPELKGMVGDKIEMYKILNKKITVYDFIIKPSKFNDKGNCQCLYMQIDVDNAKRVVFTGGILLQNMIQKIPKEKFPFETTIIKENDRYQFT